MRPSPQRTYRQLSRVATFFSPQVRKWTIRCILALFICIFGSYTLNHLQFTYQVSSYFNGKERLEQIRQQNNLLRKEVFDLELELTEVTTPDFVEKQARLRGMIQKDETVYVVVENKNSHPPSSQDNFQVGEQR